MDGSKLRRCIWFEYVSRPIIWGLLGDARIFPVLGKYILQIAQFKTLNNALKMMQYKNTLINWQDSVLPISSWSDFSIYV